VPRARMVRHDRRLPRSQAERLARLVHDIAQALTTTAWLVHRQTGQWRPTGGDGIPPKRRS